MQAKAKKVVENVKKKEIKKKPLTAKKKNDIMELRY